MGLGRTRPLSYGYSGYKYSDLAYFIGSVPHFSNGLLLSSTNKQNPCAVNVNVNDWNEIDMGYVLKCLSRLVKMQLMICDTNYLRKYRVRQVFENKW